MDRFLTGLVALLLLLPLIGSAQIVPAADTEDLVVPDTLFIGLVRVGNCDSIVIPLLNNGDDDLAIDTLFLDSDEGGVTIAPLTIPIIGSQERDSIVIRYCPADIGCFSNELHLYVSSLTDGGSRQRTIPLGGCAGAPILSTDRPEVHFRADAPLKCVRNSFSIANDGAFPLEVSRIDIDNSFFTLVPPEPPWGFVLSPGERRDFIVEFCPTAYGVETGTVSFTSDTYGASPTIRLVGTVVTDSIEVVDTIDFGTVWIGLRRDTVISVFNRGTTPGTLTGATLARTGGNDDFTLSPAVPPSQPITIPAGSGTGLEAGYHPGSVGRSEELLKLEFDNGLQQEIRLIGTAVTPAVWLDSASAVVGDRITLTLRTAAGIESPPAIGAFTMRFHIPPRSLYPIRAIMPPDSPVPILYERDGTLTIDGNAGTLTPSDGRIISIEFRGLSTGMPTNEVVIDRVSLFGVDPMEHNGAGMVYLEGCDVERERSGATKIAIGSITAAEEELSVTYTAPSGSRPELRLYDMAGSMKISVAPEPVDDPARRAILPTGDLPRGIYLLEVRWGAERAVELIPISR